MKVSTYMTRDPITIGPQTTVAEAAKLLSQNRIRQLPVLSGSRLVGIITDRDVRGHDLADAVADAMTRDPICTTAQMPMERVAHLLREQKIGSLPVTDTSGRLVGIITESDVLRAFEEISSRGEPSYLLELAVRDSSEAIREIRQVLSAHGGRLRHLATQETDAGTVKLTVYFTAARMGDVQDALEARGLGGAIVALGGDALKALGKMPA